MIPVFSTCVILLTNKSLGTTHLSPTCFFRQKYPSPKLNLRSWHLIRNINTMRVNTPWITQQTSLTYKSYKYVNNAQTSRTTNVRGFSHTPYLFGHGKRIPPAELETIVRLRRQGEEYLKIVSVLGNNRTVASVASAYHRFCKATGSDQQLGKHTFLTVSQHEDIAKLRHAGKQWREIAPVFGMSHVGLNAAHCRYMKNPARPPRRWWDDDDTKHLFHLRDDLQLPWGEVARIFNRTKSAVTRRYYLVQAEGKPDRIRLLNKYSQEELELLIDLREVQKLSWREISERLGRPLQGTRTRYSKLKMEQGNAPRSLKYHTPEEDRKLMRLRENGALSWKEVQAAMPHRSLPTLQTRFYLLRKKNGTSSAGDSAIQQSIGPKGARSFSTTTSEDFSTVSNRSISRRPLWTGLLHGPRLLSQSMFRRHRRLAHTAAVSAVEKETSEFTWRNLPRKRYTKEEDELILRRKLEGKFDVDIGMELGRSHSSIRHRFRHLHGRRRHIPQEGSTRRARYAPILLRCNSDPASVSLLAFPDSTCH